MNNLPSCLLLLAGHKTQKLSDISTTEILPQFSRIPVSSAKEMYAETKISSD
jgi:hypothetical protein